NFFSFFFFFSSRRRHTRFDCDWSSDVCSSDLQRLHVGSRLHAVARGRVGHAPIISATARIGPLLHCLAIPFETHRQRFNPYRPRSEERREGKSVDLGERGSIKKKKKKTKR